MKNEVDIFFPLKTICLTDCYDLLICSTVTFNQLKLRLGLYNIFINAHQILLSISRLFGSTFPKYEPKDYIHTFHSGKKSEWLEVSVSVIGIGKGMW